MMTTPLIDTIHDAPLREAARKALAGERLTAADGLTLYRRADLLLLSLLATHRRKQLNGQKVFYNRNFHIEPTNICVNNCVFCSYRRKAGEEGSWELSLDDVRRLCAPYAGQPVTEVHVVGGVHPHRDIHYYASLLDEITRCLPQVAIKAFTAVEVDTMSRNAGLSWREGLLLLKRHGLAAMPGGGAEIFDPTIRRQICPDKADASVWLAVHREAHLAGIRTNASMLFGHIETPEHRVAHLLQLRDLQDETVGFDAFIPLKYVENKLKIENGEPSARRSQLKMGAKRPTNSQFSILHSQLGGGGLEVLRTFAVCRLLLDNIPHLKAYWPMLGKDVMQLALLFGADDIDGTIDDSTKIYSMAGAEEQRPILEVAELSRYVRGAGFEPVERDTFYREIKQ